MNVFTNESISLSDFHGKVVILDLFATWCGPCIAAMPYIYAILYSYDPTDLVILSVDIDSRESQQLVKSFALENNMAWIVAMDNSSIVSSYYGTGYIPTMYIINQTGFVHYQEIGFDYDTIMMALDQLITPDSISPQIIDLQITLKTHPISLTSSSIEVSCQNVSDNYGVESVYAEVTSIASGTIRQYFLSLSENGTLNDIFEIDPFQLYMENSVKIQILAKDYRGNIARSAEHNFEVQMSSQDTKPPEISNITISVNMKDSYYFFNVSVKILDDILVYKVEMRLKEGTKPNYYIASYKRSEISVTSNHIIWIDSSDPSIFRAMFKIKESEITDIENIHVTVIAEDLVGGKTTLSSQDSNNTSWNGTFLLIILLSLVSLLKKLRRC
jgi:thiol-disulfide isomerase/thioredoxin